MARKSADQPSAAPSGAGPIAAILSDAAESQARALALSQGWSESVLGTITEQAETYHAMLASIDASMRAMEQAVKSQTETTQALTQSLEASRRVVSSAMAAQQQGLDRVESFVGGLLDVLTGQTRALQKQMEMGQAMLSDPISAQTAAFAEMTQQWLDAYSRLLSTDQVRG